jgi:hypothetical protein
MLEIDELGMMFFFCVIAYILAFYFKNLSLLPEKQGWIIFIFFHIPALLTFLITSEKLKYFDNTIMTLAFAGVFLFRFFKKDV